MSIDRITYLMERALDGSDQTLNGFIDRIVDITVTQVAGDHTCPHPRAALHLIADAGDNADQALLDLPLAPALIVDLSLSDGTSDHSKVAIS